MIKKLNTMDSLIALAFILSCFVAAAVMALVFLSVGGITALLALIIGVIIGYLAGVSAT